MSATCNVQTKFGSTLIINGKKHTHSLCQTCIHMLVVRGACTVTTQGNHPPSSTTSSSPSSASSSVGSVGLGYARPADTPPQCSAQKPHTQNHSCNPRKRTPQRQHDACSRAFGVRVQYRAPIFSPSSVCLFVGWGGETVCLYTQTPIHIPNALCISRARMN